MAQLDWIKSPSDLKLLSLFWSPLPSENAIAVTDSDGKPLLLKVAYELVDEFWAQIASMCSASGHARAYIYGVAQGKTKRFEVPASLANCEMNEGISIQPPMPAMSDNSILIIPEIELRESHLENSSKPIYINRIFDQENLYANPAALEAQGQKPKFLGQTAYSLNDVSELEARCGYLLSGETLGEYEYKAWRWYFDADAGRWRLKRMAFVSNFRKINSCDLGRHLKVKDEPLWFGEVLSAVELAQRKA
jgi:hypothetical protein